MKFLIDECLSPTLVGEAQSAGSEAYHVVHLGRAGIRDWTILSYALDHDLVLVTNNASDFREHYAAQSLHPGLVIIIPNVNRNVQIRMFRAVLAHLRTTGEPVNKAFEIDIDQIDIIIREYELSSGD